MADFSDLLDQIPTKDLAKQFGVSEDVIDGALTQILPGLVSGLAANAQGGGEASLEKALAKHQGKSTKLADIDTADGEKIVKNVFGEKKNDVVKAVAGSSKAKGATQELIEQLLPVVAPIVLAWVASQFFGGKEETKASTKETKSESSSGGLGDLLGGLLSSKQGSDALGGLLGGLLGGGKK